VVVCSKRKRLTDGSQTDYGDLHTYFGHVVCMGNVCLPHIVLHERTSGHRRPERPRKKWTDNIVEDCQQMNIFIHEAERLAYDRHKWWFMLYMKLRDWPTTDTNGGLCRT